MIVTVLAEVTSLWVTVNETLEEPLPTLTEAGTVARAVFELVSRTVAPDVAASPVSITEPATGVADPPTTDPGDTDTLPSVAGWIVSVAV